MERVEIEAVEDRTRPEGGHAVILLRGINDVAGSGKFRLAAVDDHGLVPGLRAILDQIHEPLAVRRTQDGVALEIGPGLADSAVLIPGMVLELTLIDIDKSGEFLWPIVTPLARPKRRNIMTRRTAGEPARLSPAPAVAAASPSVAALEVRDFPTSAVEQPLAAGTAERGERHGTDGEALTASTSSPAVLGAQDGLDERVPPTRPLDILAAAMPEHSEPSDGTNAGVTADDRASAVKVDDEPLALPQEEQLNAAAIVPIDPKPSAASSAPAASPAGDPVVADPPPADQTLPSQPPYLAARAISPLAAAFVAAVVLMAGQFAVLRFMDLRLVKRATPPAVPSTTASPQERPKPAAGIFDLLATGPTSPRGIAADNVSPARALELAHVHQHGPEGQRDRDEAVFWLKRYVRATVGSEPQRIALTQLGSAYARPSFRTEPDGKRDLAKAMIAWEMAGALGDPVAICFLATLYAQGIGVPADKSHAELWFSRASEAKCAVPQMSAR